MTGFIKQKGLVILFFLIFVFGFLPRAQETISHNFIFLIDQGRDMMAVKSIVYDQHVTLIGPYTSLQGIFQGPLWYYMLSVVTFFTGGDPWGGVVLMLVISLATLITSFILAKSFFGINVAIATAFLIAICPEAIAAATYSWNPHPMWLLLPLYLFTLFQLNLGKKKYHLFLWPIIGLMFNFQTALGVFIFLASAMYLSLFNRKIIKTKEALIGMVLFFLTLSPQIVFDLRHGFLMSNSFLNAILASNGPVQNISPGHFLATALDHLYVYSINFNSSFLRLGILQNIQIFFFWLLVFGIVFGKKSGLLNKKEVSFVQMTAKIIGIVILLSVFYPFPLRAWFLTGFELFYIFPLGIILGKLWNYKAGKLALSIFVAVSLSILLPRIYDLYTKPDYGGIAKFKGKLGAIDYVYKDAGKNPFNLLVFTPPINTDAYDYLVFWRAKNLYHYLPGKEKRETFYLLIEPDPAQPWTYKGWLETVIKTGKVVSTTTLPSGLIIQKRVN